VLARYLPYVEREVARGTPLKSMTRHLLGLRAGLAGGRSWRRALSELGDGPAGLRRLYEIAAQFAPARAEPAHGAVAFG
jgi:tRNA-dihydrouridine synthase A